ncbi:MULTISPECIES: Fe(3+) ABC transporter substrate-binding protein [Marinomonas]|uniref:Iron(III) transport system substrate-binding protein n=1 Tax=Marinomonas alcarazii TaxID=491949 RepID=A0A318V0I3_9GAMM|nr:MULTISPECIES: Fe(3+) ABC transporter substrate-binding protein [Marinomonas]PYF81038.1 iron(III) transport system substrate-binding protein [Marinomonas alcarazii]
MKRPTTKTSLFTLAGATTLLALSSTSAHASGEVNVYSARSEALIAPLLDIYSKENNVKVNLITGSADALLSRLQSEGDASPADVFITVDAGRLYRAKEAGVLQPFETSHLNKVVPDHLKDRDGYWYGLSQRARVVLYNPEKVSADDLSTYEDLADPKWKGKICIRSSSNIYNQSLVASMIDANGEKQTLEWIKGLVANFARPPAGGDTDQIKAAAAGVCDIAVANTYYFGRLGLSDKADDRAVFDKLKMFWPNQAANERGAHVNVSGIGITASSKNTENAKQLIDFLTNKQSQEWYAKVNNEYAVIEGVAPPKSLSTFGEFKADQVSLSVLGENNRQAVKLMDQGGWK